MKRFGFIFCLLLFGCDACEEKKVIKASNFDDDVFSPMDLGSGPGDVVVNNNEDVLIPEVIPSSVHDGYISCGDVGTCLKNFVCINQNLCCPETMPQECGGKCFPADCTCIEDNEFVFCLPDNMEYCGKGVSCPKGECYEDDGNFYCVSENEKYCGAGVVCNLELKEVCHQENDQFYCAPEGYISCFGQDRWCKESEICTENSCCPKVQPIECGQTCCYPDEPCVDAAKSVCQPKGAEYCNGAICVAGETCAPNNLADCIAENADICANGMVCPPGSVCSIGEEGECCPQGQPQRCGKICCPANFTCMETDFGKKCFYPGEKPCGDGACDPGEFCADGLLGICAEDGSDPCDDGHICEPGTYCAGPTCCSFINANQSCGTLCCPSDWQCINVGEACIPPDATYLGNGKYCDIGTKFNEENGNCDPVGWEPCGAGPACKPGSACSEEETDKQCCPLDQETLCGDKCCFSGFQCFHDGAKNVCIPQGADYCWGQNVNEWCSPGKKCGKKGKNCIPFGAMECENGDFCSMSEKCTESSPSCCPWAAPVPCIDKCCSSESTCAEINGEWKCVSGQLEICSDTIVGDTLCLAKESFCGSDGGCIDNKWKGIEYIDCGGGGACGIEQSCGALCSGICCDATDLDDKCEEKIKECLPNYGCSETKTTVSCCKYVGQQGNANGLADCIGEICKNLQCGVSGSNGSSVCCSYDKATPVGCVNGCIPDGQVCYDQPIPSFNHPTESGIYPNEVPNEIGSYCSNGDIVSWIVGVWSLGFVTFDVYFQPAGFDVKYHDGVYHVEEGDKDTQGNDNWIVIAGNPGDEILIIEWVWIKDNLEGNDCPHGPYAQFYILIHKKGSEPAKLEKPMLSSILNSTAYGNQLKFLKGPLFSGSDTWKFCLCYGLGWLGICFAETCFNGDFETGAEQEWVDFLKVNYTPNKAGIHKWEKNEDQIYFTLRERDGNASFWGIDIIRWDDFMGLQAISKKETKKPCGQTIDLHVYRSVAEDDNPDNDGDLDPEGNPYYYKTNKIGARIKFRTITCTGKPGDPC